MSVAVARRRVLLAVNSGERGGAELMALAAAEELSKRHDVLVSVPEGPLRPAFGAHAELLSGTGGVPMWPAGPRRWARSMARSAVDGRRLAAELRARRVDIVLANSVTCVGAVAGARRAGVPSVVHFRDWPGTRLAPVLLRLHAAWATVVVAISHDAARLVPRSARVEIIPDGIVPTAAPRPVRPWPSAPRLLVLGAVDRRKGQDVAVRALAEVRAAGLAASMRLVGGVADETFAQQVRRLADRLGVAEHVTWAGRSTDVVTELDAADVLLAPSRGEWTPLAIMEALDREVPVVAADAGSCRDIVLDGETGQLVPVGDASAVARAVLAIAADPEAAHRQAARGRRHVAMHFDRRRSITQLEAVALDLASSFDLS